MPRITVTLSEAAKEWVEAESEARGCSQSDVLADLVDEARGAAAEKPVPDRLKDLERRVSELEECINPMQSDADSDAEPHQSDADSDAKAHQTDAESEFEELERRDGAAPHEAEEKGYQRAVAAVEELEWPAGPRTGEERARAAVRAVVDYINEQGSAGKSEILENVYPDHQAEFDKPENWWVNFIIKRLQELRDEHGVVRDTGGGRFTEWKIASGSGDISV